METTTQRGTRFHFQFAADCVEIEAVQTGVTVVINRWILSRPTMVILGSERIMYK